MPPTPPATAPSPVEFFDRLIDATSKLSALAHLRGMIAEAETTDARRCGNCEFWMQSSNCPREVNVNGRNRGPSMNAMACDKFLVKSCVVELKVKRLGAARGFALEHGFTETAAAIAAAAPKGASRAR